MGLGKEHLPRSLQEQHGVLSFYSDGGCCDSMHDGEVGRHHVPVAAAGQAALLHHQRGVEAAHSLQTAGQGVELEQTKCHQRFLLL